jgi:GGDEF domain-containing protein
MTSELQSPEVWNRLKGLFGRSDASEADQMGQSGALVLKPTTKPSSEKKGAAQDQFVSDRQDFESRLQQFLSQNRVSADVVSGRVHLLDTQDIRNRFGSRWEKVTHQVHRTIQDTLKNRLGKKDFFTRYDADTYIMMFGDSSEQEAKLKCAILADEIKSKILGDGESELAGSLGVQTVITQVDGSVAIESLPSADALAALLEKEADNSSASSEQVVGPNPYADRALTPEEVADLLGVAETQMQAIERDGNAQIGSGAAEDRLEDLVRQLRNFEKALAAADTWQSNQSSQDPDRQPAGDWQSQYFSALSVIHKLTERAEDQLARHKCEPSWVYEAEEKKDLSLTAAFSYIPVWHVAKQAIGAHFCQVSLEFDRERIPYTKLIGNNLGDEVTRTIDRILVRKAIQDLKESVSTGTVHIVGIPVHYSTLDGLGSQRDFQYLCHAIPQDLHNNLIWEIVNAPVESWRVRLPVAISAAKPFGRAIFLRMDPFRTSLSEIIRSLKNLQGVGVHAVGMDLTGMPISESDGIAVLERFAATAHRCGLMRYAFGLNSLSLVTAAVCAGFDHVAGLTVAKPTDLPGGVSPTTTESLYMQRFGHTS